MKKMFLVMFLLWSFCGAVIRVENQTGEPNENIFFVKVGRLAYLPKLFITKNVGLIFGQYCFGGDLIKTLGYKLVVNKELQNLNKQEEPIPLEDNKTYILVQRDEDYFLRGKK